MAITPDDLKWAVEAFGVGAADYKVYRDYYHGTHDLGFATPKFQSTFGTLFKTLAYNRCRPVVDSQANKMRVKAFKVNGVDLAGLQIIEQGQTTPGAVTSASGTDFGDQAMTLWRLGGMHMREGEIYTESAMTGDAYGVVYFDVPPPLGTGLPKLWPQRADLMRVRYDDDARINLAAKSWLVTSGPDKNKRRLTFYTPFEIIRLITTGTAESELPKELGQYTLVREVNALGQAVMNPVTHPLGRVPVVHYPNNAPMAGDMGISELKDVIPLQNALNKSIADMMVAMEYNAFPQRFAIGIDAPDPDPITGKRKLPWKAGPGEVWYSTNKEAKFGSFEVSQLDQYLKVQDQFDLDIARVSFTPVHWIIMTGTPPSGESLKTGVEPFTTKIRDRERSAGAGHGDALAMMFKLMGIQEPLLIETEWESPEPRSDKEQAEIGKTMADAGVPLVIAARIMGLTESDIALIEAAETEAALQREQAMAQLAGTAMTDAIEGDQDAAANQ